MKGQRAKVYDIPNAWEWLELAYQNKWTDGLVVAPPTQDKVEEVLQYLGQDPAQVVGIVPPRQGIATIEKIAINSVMAGCKPEYVPIVSTALESMLREEFTLDGVETSTSPVEPLVIVSGPIVQDLGFNCGDGVFGGGSRANAAVGRAIRLILWNIGGSIPGETARSPLSHPGRYTYCIAENNVESPWGPVHMDFGIPAEESAVTVFPCDAPHSICMYECDTLRMLNTIADTMSSMATLHMQQPGQSILVLSAGAAQYLAKDGYNKARIQEYLFQNARRTLRQLSKGYFNPSVGCALMSPWIDQRNLDTTVPVSERPEDIVIVVAGGSSGYWWAAWCPGWGDGRGRLVCQALKPTKATAP